MSNGAELDVLTLKLDEALLSLLERGATVRVEPYVAPFSTDPVASWRVARQISADGSYTVLTVVPEIEGRVQCTDGSPNPSTR